MNTPRPGEPLSDPKDKIEVFNLMLAPQGNAGKERAADRLAPAAGVRSIAEVSARVDGRQTLT
jgi:hypothetical protein